MLTWCGQQKAQEAFLYWCCVSLTNKKMLMALQRAQAISILRWAIIVHACIFRWAVIVGEGSFRLWSFIRFTSPLFSWNAPCSWWRAQFLVVPFPACGPPLLGCLLAWTLFLAPRSFFSPFSGCFLFMKFGRISSHLRFHTQYMNLNPIQIQLSCIRFKLHYANSFNIKSFNQNLISTKLTPFHQFITTGIAS